MSQRQINSQSLNAIKDTLASRANQGDKEAQYKLARHYLKNNQNQAAERWLRYAAIQNHHLAYRSLVIGTRHDLFLTTLEHIRSFAKEILIALVTPNPTKHQINELEQLIIYHLNTEFNLMKPHYEKE